MEGDQAEAAIADASSGSGAAVPSAAGGNVTASAGNGRAPAPGTPEPPPIERQLHVILPRRGLSALDFSEIWAFRSLFVQLSKRDITLRYRQAALGVAWVVLQPIIGAGIFTFIFHSVAHLSTGKNGPPYYSFAFAGMIIWTAFSTTIGNASTSVLVNQPMITKVFFPRILLPLETVSASAINAFVSLGMAFVVIAIQHVPFTWRIVTWPVWLLLALLLSEGVGMIAAALMVRYRDISYIVPVVVQFLFYLSAVGYPASAVPHKLRFVVTFNPITGLLEGSRWSLLNQPLDMDLVLYSVIAAVVLFLVGAWLFDQLERTFGDTV